MGAVGAVIATAIAQATVTVMAIYLGRRYLRQVFSPSFLLPFITSAAVMAIVIFMIPHSLNIMLKTAISIFAYTLLLLVLDHYSGKNIISIFIRKRSGAVSV
jgi:ABC-type spermidine/putrescine transport system permease subunit II